MRDQREDGLESDLQVEVTGRNSKQGKNLVLTSRKILLD